MQCCYSVCLSSVTCVVVLLPWVGAAFIITGLILLFLLNSSGFWMAIFGTVAIVIGLFMRERDAMTTIRAGAWPALCRGDRRPHDHDSMLAAIEELQPYNFDVVGGGWTSWMNRTFASRPALFTDRFSGFDPEEKKWRCGTTIYEMEEYYSKKKIRRAFPTFPTNGTIALGSWIACENHGNSGDMTGPSHDPFNEVVLVRRADGALIRLVLRLRKSNDFTWFEVVRKEGDSEVILSDEKHPCPAARKMMQQHKNKFVVLYAGIDEEKLIKIDDENEWLQYSMIEIRTPDDLSKWLNVGAALRWLFIGSARTYGLGVRLEPLLDKPRPMHRPFPWCFKRPHKEPHFGSVTCRYFQSDPCSFCCGWHEAPDKWNGFVDRKHANDWYPNMFWPAVTLGGVLGGIYNFEIIFISPKGVLDGQWLHPVLQDLINFFQRHRGRCEVRCMNKTLESWVFLDCGIASKWCGEQVFDGPYRILHDHGVFVVSNHTGKFMPPDKYLSGMEPNFWKVRRVPSYDLVKETDLERKRRIRTLV